MRISHIGVFCALALLALAWAFIVGTGPGVPGEETGIQEPLYATEEIADQFRVGRRLEPVVFCVAYRRFDELRTCKEERDEFGLDTGVFGYTTNHGPCWARSGRGADIHCGLLPAPA